MNEGDVIHAQESARSSAARAGLVQRGEKEEDKSTKAHRVSGPKGRSGGGTKEVIQTQESARAALQEPGLKGECARRRRRQSEKEKLHPTRAETAKASPQHRQER